MVETHHLASPLPLLEWPQAFQQPTLPCRISCRCWNGRRPSNSISPPAAVGMAAGLPTAYSPLPLLEWPQAFQQPTLPCRISCRCWNGRRPSNSISCRCWNGRRPSNSILSPAAFPAAVGMAAGLPTAFLAAVGMAAGLPTAFLAAVGMAAGLPTAFLAAVGMAAGLPTAFLAAVGMAAGLPTAFLAAVGMTAGLPTAFHQHFTPMPDYPTPASRTLLILIAEKGLHTLAGFPYRLACSHGAVGKLLHPYPIFPLRLRFFFS